jgi:hypothetical protein
MNRYIKMDVRKNETHRRKNNYINVIVNWTRKDIEKFLFLNRTSKDWNTWKGIAIENVKIGDFRKLLIEGKFE